MFIKHFSTITFKMQLPNLNLKRIINYLILLVFLHDNSYILNVICVSRASMESFWSNHFSTVTFKMQLSNLNFKRIINYLILLVFIHDNSYMLNIIFVSRASTESFWSIHFKILKMSFKYKRCFLALACMQGIICELAASRPSRESQ